MTDTIVEQPVSISMFHCLNNVALRPQKPYGLLGTGRPPKLTE